MHLPVETSETRINYKYIPQRWTRVKPGNCPGTLCKTYSHQLTFQGYSRSCITDLYNLKNLGINFIHIGKAELQTHAVG